MRSIEELQTSLSAAENDVATIAEQFDSANRKLAAADQKRRALALAAHTGVAAAQKPLKVATNERDDARTLCEDLESALFAAREKAQEIARGLEMARLRTQAANLRDAGLKAALGEIVDLHDRLRTACGRLLELCAE